MIRINNLNIRHHNKVIFDNFNLHVKANEKIVITGKSGCGKTTLIKTLMGFVSQFEGSILINDTPLCPENINQIRSQIAYMPQTAIKGFDTVTDFLMTPFKFNTHKKKKINNTTIASILEMVNLPKSILSQKTKDLSGGEMQRLMLVICLLQNKPILILDEPTSALDLHLRQEVTDLVTQLQNITLISISHDEYWINAVDKIIKI